MTDNGNSIKFTFEDCPQYLYNGVIEVPKNSLTMVIDESGMVTFRKSASNDIFLSCFYSELGMSKNEVEAWYQEHGVKDTPSAEEVEDMIEDATQDYFDGAEYDSNSKRINFKHGNTIKGYIDASDFVIDGMVDDVKIENGYLVITFNTESGKQPISIPLTDIFNPNNYYDKTATDALLATKADTATTYTKSEVDAALSGKANSSDVYTKSETSGATQISTALSDKQDTLIAGSGITISGNVISSEGGGGKAISAGTNISITTGETADTINCTVPISATTLGLECLNSSQNSKTGNSITEQNFIGGSSNKIGGDGERRKFSNNFIWGTYNQIVDDNWAYDASSINNIICGWGNKISGASNSYNSIFGYGIESYGKHQTLFGYFNKSINGFETSFGQYNNSVSASTTFGDSGNTLFSVGNGHYNGRHNGFEIRQNGDIYIVDTNDTSTTNWYQKPMIKLQDQLGGGNNVVTLTQAEYDSLVDKDPTAFYIISDAEEIDVDNYYTKSETSGATQISTALSGKQDTLSAGTGINITDNVISATGGGGGGKAVSGGTNISVTTGETADTINCTLPISADTNTIRINKNNIKIGTNTITTSNLDRVQVAIGDNVTANGIYSFAFGAFANATNYTTVSMGYGVESNNQYQTSFGRFNVTSSASTTFGDSGNTLFSVGNGTSFSERHNAFEIRQNGDIYLTKDGQDVKLQDTITATAANTTALGGLSLVKLTQTEYSAMEQAGTLDNSTLYIVIDS